MITHILITLVWWVVLMYLSINILGFWVRGFFEDSKLSDLEKENDFLKNEVGKLRKADKIGNWVGFIVLAIFLYCLYRFWNLGVLMVAILIMLARLPDLIWEIKHGKKINPELLPKNFVYFGTTFLTIISLPLLYYSLYHF